MVPEDVVLALNAANNERDAAAMRALIAPNAHFIQDPGEPGSTDQSRDEFIVGATAQNSSSSSISGDATHTTDTAAACSSSSSSALSTDWCMFDDAAEEVVKLMR